MKKWEIDVPVLCIFFARPIQFAKSFEQVRKARPKVLLLWQDGPRDGREDDWENIKKCRDIAANIDWECEVHKNYHDKNMGCDPSTFYSHKWAFSLVDKCIILEDDLIASQSFFSFCKVLLDKYENDYRVDRICGTNPLGVYEDVTSDYFFTKRGHSWGWATWKRVADSWDSNYEFLNHEYYLKQLIEHGIEKKQQTSWLDKCKIHQQEKVPYWEFIVGARTLLHSGLVIFPKKNLITNIGIGENSAHTNSDLKDLPLSVQRKFNTKAYEIDFPLKSPLYFIDDIKFQNKCNEIAHQKGFVEKNKRLFKRIITKLKNGTLVKTLYKKLKH